MADALVWHLIRDNSSFLVKRGRTNRNGSVQLSSEPGNLLNVNTFKHSGLANGRTIAISGGKSVVVTTKTDELTKPARSTKVVAVKNGAAIAAVASGYRSDLASAAAARYKRVFSDVVNRRLGGRKARPVRSRGTR